MSKANPCLHAFKEKRSPADEDNAAWLATPEAQEFLSAQTRRDEKTGCLIWTGKTQKRFAYGYFYRRSKILYSHRAAYVVARGSIPKGKVICHRCDNPSCIAIEHLFLGTQEENLADMWSKGRARWRTLLTRAHVVEIKQRLSTGETVASIARDTGVSRGVIQAVKSGRTWGHVQGGTVRSLDVLRRNANGAQIMVKRNDGNFIMMDMDEFKATMSLDWIPLFRMSEE